MAVLLGTDDFLEERSRVIVEWSRTLAAGELTTADHIDRLRDVGFTSAETVHLTQVIALRVAFTRINGASGAFPEKAYVNLVDAVVREAWLQATGQTA